jgi:poly-gamma-glutamate synthesis protein (capsule biosynthesis protein)
MKNDILICGDFYVGEHAGGRLVPFIENKEFELMFGDLYNDLKDAELSIVNLEGAIISNGNPISKTGPAIAMQPAALEALFSAGVNLVTLANNHVMDFGTIGLEETLDRLGQKEIHFVGAGLSNKEKNQPYITKIKSKAVGIINICEHEWIADFDSEAGANGLDIINNYKQIQELSLITDFIIVIYHGGNEYHPLPTKQIKKLFRFFVDAGASAVVGHHTHTFSGFELYKESPIFYSIGNFIFDSNKKGRGENWHTGIAVILNIDNDILQFKIIPFSQNLEQLGIKKLDGEQLLNFQTKFNEYSDTIVDDEKLDIEYTEFAKKMSLQYLAYLNPYEGKMSSLFKKGILPSVYSKNKELLFLNLIRCESHKELLETILSNKIKN